TSLPATPTPLPAISTPTPLSATSTPSSDHAINHHLPPPDSLIDPLLQTQPATSQGLLTDPPLQAQPFKSLLCSLNSKLLCNVLMLTAECIKQLCNGMSPSRIM
ncbi:hypothetical protein L208DRAFT_1409889, partial [Tricholoma matsutake]